MNAKISFYEENGLNDGKDFSKFCKQNRVGGKIPTLTSMPL